MSDPLEPYEGKPCPVCGLPDPEHDWDAHDAQPAPEAPEQRGRAAALPNMLLRSSTRGRYSVRVLALHTTEGILKARDLRAWGAWPGSSHASADADGVLLEPADGFVPYHLAAWTLRSGNPWSENIELCGFASWTRAEWLARPKLLEAAAVWLARRHLATGVPLVKITAQQYRAGASGVIDHDDHTEGYLDGTHWDIGEFFPYDIVLPRARQLAGLTPPPVPTARLITPEVPVLALRKGEQLTLPVPPVPAGYKAVLSLAGDTVRGVVVYVKGQNGAKAEPVLTSANGWRLWLAPGKREDRDVSRFQVVELVSDGAEGKGGDEATCGVTLTLLPA